MVLLELKNQKHLYLIKDLTSNTVVGWVKAKLNSEDSEAVAKIESALAANIAEQKTPTIGTGLPWATPA